MDKTLTQLETVLKNQLLAHGKLADLVNRKVTALKRADFRAVAGLLEEENKLVQAIGELEKERLQLVAQLTQALEPRAARPWRLSELAERLPEPWRGKLAALRASLREQLLRGQRDSTLARQASTELVRHVQGLMQNIGVAMTGVAGYTHRGTAPRAALQVSTFEAKA